LNIKMGRPIGDSLRCDVLVKWDRGEVEHMHRIALNIDFLRKSGPLSYLDVDILPFIYLYRYFLWRWR
jgi:hypothetical protein